ncbi:ABC transporter permease [Actibacterium lipolyticum]|uniref:Putrescine transport system permease protein PotH n=1 Tax=Actibacterium lipolyticum TaxID=1524263 RepID=A0A238KQ98_9RHOB|nr:ABC transporter permease [Actibacterium lipolyticum]SMX44965.1 Putrescine transport system permease protein PotH [Actibacterium lipolyticum]
MKELLRGYGRGLVSLFVAAILGWALVLIVLPQLTMLERAVTAPKRLLDSSVAGALARDANTCVSVLKTYAKPAPAPADSGLAVPSMGGMSVPSMGGMAVPSASGGATRPYILQCDRANTHTSMVRPTGEIAWLDELYNLPALSVDDTAPIPDQSAQASQIAAVAQDLYQQLLRKEATQSNLSLNNFQVLMSATMIPMSPEQKRIEERSLSATLYSAVGLRYEQDGQVYKRLGLITLTRTLSFAVMATALALILCYPVAYKVALATPPERATWLFLGLVIPYAIVELMRIYAWTAIIDNQGLLNSALMWVGVIDDPLQFKRMPGTVFVVIVYTYVLFMVFPIFNVMSTLDRNQIEAAKDLGASPWRVHRRVIIPHSKPGIAVGCIATFMLAAGAFSVPRIISRGLQAEWFSQTIYNKFFESENSNIGAAYSFAYTFVCFALVGVFMWAMRTRLKDFARVQ